MVPILLLLGKFFHLSIFPSAGILSSLAVKTPLAKTVFSKLKIFYPLNYQEGLIHFEVYMKETALQLILLQDCFL